MPYWTLTSRTYHSFEAWIFTAAFCAVIKLGFPSTAVSTIPIAATVVVRVVAVAITFVIWTSTMTLALGRVC